MFTTIGSRVPTKKKPIVAIATSGNGTTISTAFFTVDQRSSSKTKRLIVPAGVTLGAALTGSMNGKLEIIVLGNVDGLGGAGSTTDGVAGSNGGDAIRCDMDNVTIKVRGGGNLRGGGGGGGKGGAGTGALDGPYYTRDVYDYSLYIGQLYLSWAGSSLIAGGTWNPTSVDTGGYRYFAGAYQGNDGADHWAVSRALLGGGVGGNGGKGRGYDGANTSGAAATGSGGVGGNGGTWAAVGTAGTAGNTGGGSAAGSAGKAANFNGKNGCAVVNEGGTVSGIAA